MSKTIICEGCKKRFKSSKSKGHQIRCIKYNNLLKNFEDKKRTVDPILIGVGETLSLTAAIAMERASRRIQ